MSQNNPCHSCRHWTPLPCVMGVPLTGTCRRYPPVLDPSAPPVIGGGEDCHIEILPRWVRPETDAYDTCGEWSVP